MEVAEPLEELVRERVRELLAARPDVNQTAFGAAIGRGYSWVSAFLTGTRHANDIHLLKQIARFFGVSVGYLLGEVERSLDPGAATLLATWDNLSQRDRKLLLTVAAQFRSPTAELGPEGGAAPNQGAARNTVKAAAPRNRKRHSE